LQFGQLFTAEVTFVVYQARTLQTHHAAFPLGPSPWRSSSTPGVAQEPLGTGCRNLSSTG
jgi:hypothetical protein